MAGRALAGAARAVRVVLALVPRLATSALWATIVPPVLAVVAVPLIVSVEGLRLRPEGILADVAPTALELLAIPLPEGMHGHSLVDGAK